MFLSHQPVDREKGKSEISQVRQYTRISNQTAGLARCLPCTADLVSNSAKQTLNSIVSLLTSRVEPDEEFSYLIIHPNQNGMWYGHKPVLNPGNKKEESEPWLI